MTNGKEEAECDVPSTFDIRHSFDIRPSSFDIGHGRRDHKLVQLEPESALAADRQL
jgi:hypothetical protein